MTNLRIVVTAVLWASAGLTCAQTSTGSAKQHYANAQHAMQVGDYAAAAAELEAAAKLAPDNAVILYDLAIVLDRQDKKTEASQKLQQAIRLGLPSELKEKAQALLAKLNRPKQTDTGADEIQSSQESLMRRLNKAVGTISPVNNRYKEIGFTLDTSVGKLWFVVFGAGGCPLGFARVHAIGVRPSDLDPDLISSGTDDNGEDEIRISCKKDLSRGCMEHWASPEKQCFTTNRFPQYHDLRDTGEFNPAEYSAGDYIPELVFNGRNTSTGVPTTGDLRGTDKAIQLLKQLVTAAHSQ